MKNGSSSLDDCRKVLVTTCLLAAALAANAFTVPDIRTVQNFSFAAETTFCQKGCTRQLSLKDVYDNSGQSWLEKRSEAVWTSMDTSIVSISSSGVATFKRVGAAKLEAKLDGVARTTNVVVDPELIIGIYGPRGLVLSPTCYFGHIIWSGGSGSGYTYAWHRDGAYLGNDTYVYGYFDDYFDISLTVTDSHSNVAHARYWLTHQAGETSPGCYNYQDQSGVEDPPTN